MDAEMMVVPTQYKRRFVNERLRLTVKTNMQSSFVQMCRGIELKKKQLVELARDNNTSLSSGIILERSQELDVLIALYYQLNSELSHTRAGVGPHAS